MAEVLISYFKETLPDELASALDSTVEDLEQGRFEQILTHELVQNLVGHKSLDQDSDETATISPFDWNDYIFDQLGQVLSKRDPSSIGDIKESPAYVQNFFFIAALAALYAFVQAAVTGPPLPFDPASTLLSQNAIIRAGSLKSLQSSLIKSLGIDGEAAYRLTPNVELISFADSILISPPVRKNVKVVEWAKLRVDFVHQRLLSTSSSTLQALIYESLKSVDNLIAAGKQRSSYNDVYSQYLLERATVHAFFDLDKRCKEDLKEAANLRNFEFALTGKLGKRTKYQHRDTSQLVVLAKSANQSPAVVSLKGSQLGGDGGGGGLGSSNPANLDLNDDTLLESISFAKKTPDLLTEPIDEALLPHSLAELDPGNQPQLDPLDATLLLSMAASITNTSPEDGLTREGTLPFAARVLEGGSSNWQVYTQALLIRSRIEGYNSRTTERGLLQLQALVDQVIADTTPEASPSLVVTDETTNSTFLPRPKASESAPASERLRYVFQLCSPARWELEAELAARWINLGGLRSALDIYERLEMWPEAALCLAAVDREAEASAMIRKLLFHSQSSKSDVDVSPDDRWLGQERDPPPDDAPRLYCILGDLTEDISKYEKAWTLSKGRYARAQRSLGRHYLKQQDYVKAAQSYTRALKANQLNHSSWFALGCALLELSEYEKAAEAFVRTVQLDDADAEAWSNLAAALLRKGPPEPGQENKITVKLDDEEFEGQASDGSSSQLADPQKYKKDALNAFKRAASLKYGNYRIWENVMTVAVSLEPPAWSDVLAAQNHILDLRGSVDGEKCLDVQVLELLVRHVVTAFEPPSSSSFSSQSPNGSNDYAPVGSNSNRYGLPRLVLDIFDNKIQPLITNSARLWRLVSTLAVWRKDMDAALAAQEKAWRVSSSASTGWETGTEEQWNDVVEATIDLADSYESLGVDKWQTKARNAVKGILGRGKQSWEDTSGWNKLMELRESLSGKK